MKISFLLFCLIILSFKANAQEWNQWHFHIDVTVQPQADDSFDAVYADFTHLLKSTFETSGTLDENSIRVTLLQKGQPVAAVPYRFVKTATYDATTNAAGTLIFSVAAAPDVITAQYRVYFDITANGTKAAFPNSSDVPEAANMIWNSSFEILSHDYTGANRYANAGENMPRGWWGNLRNSGMTTNLASSAHSGRHALGFVAKPEKHLSISTAPSPPALRIAPGQTYIFSFWIKGKELTSQYPAHASIYWYGKDQQRLSRINIDTNTGRSGNFDWTKCQVILTAPENAHFATMYIGTYSNTGVLTVDDLNVHVAVPPLLEEQNKLVK